MVLLIRDVDSCDPGGVSDGNNSGWRYYTKPSVSILIPVV